MAPIETEANNSMLFIGSGDTFVYALRLADGRKIWSFKTRDAVEAPPSVVGGAVVVGSSDGFLYSLDAATGKILWNVPAHTAVPTVKRHPKATHCNSTPATDGSNIVALFSSEGLFCFNAKDGSKRWERRAV